MYLKGSAVIPYSNAFYNLENADENTQKINRAIRNVMLEVAKIKPQTIILISKEGNVFDDAFSADYTSTLSGEYSQEDFHTEQTVSCDLGFLEEFYRRSGRDELPVYLLNDTTAKENHIVQRLTPEAVQVLYFLRKVYPDFKVVQLCAGDLENDVLYQIGMMIRESCEANKKDAYVLCLTNLAELSDSDQEGAGTELNDLIYTAFSTQDYLPLLKVDPMLIRKAKFESYDALITLLGLYEKLKTKLSIEYFGKQDQTGLICFESSYLLDDSDFLIPSILEVYQKDLEEERKILIENEHDLIKMIRSAASLWLKENRQLDLSTYLALMDNEELKNQLLNQYSGVFVSVYQKNQLRGSMGSILPYGENIGEAIIHYTIEALSYDSRFVSVEEDALSKLRFTCDIAEKPEYIDSIDELDPSKYGLILEQGIMRAIILPNMPGIETPQEQYEEAKLRAGIYPGLEDPDERIILQRFTTEHIE